MVQPNIGESGSKSAARALELVLPKAQINFQDRDQLCGSKISSANLYIRVIQNTIVLLIACIELIYALWNVQNWEL